MALVTAAWMASAATTTHKTTKKKHTVATASKTKSTTKTSTRSKTKAKGKTRRTARSYQQHPTPDRYKEIQDALANKGYFHGEANGEWGPDSVDALKRFQADQNLMPDGKIGSLSLIALGLGPKRLTARSEPSAHAAAPVPTPAASQ
jgi:murein L,D-transpeptidase YcbB/YkuD